MLINHKRLHLTTSESKLPSQVNRRIRNVRAKMNSIGTTRKCRSLRILTKERTQGMPTTEINSKTRNGKLIMIKRTTMTRSMPKKMTSRTSSYSINNTLNDLSGNRITTRRFFHDQKISLTRLCQLNLTNFSSIFKLRQPTKRPIQSQGS